MNVSFNVLNNGANGIVTPQIYLSLLDEPSANGIVHPVLQLAAFSKFEIPSLANQRVVMKVPKDPFFKSVEKGSLIHY